MLQCFYPDKYIVSTYQINFDRLYEQGYRGIIFDIDNTLVEHGAPADERSIALFRAMKKLGCNTGNTLFVGDQLFTDVWGARRCGIYSILVQPIARHEEIQIVLKRYLEKIVLASYKRTCRKQGRIFLYKEDKDAD